MSRHSKKVRFESDIGDQRPKISMNDAAESPVSGDRARVRVFSRGSNRPAEEPFSAFGGVPVKTDSEGFLIDQTRGVHDEGLLRRELYNPYDFDIVFERDRARDLYVRAAGIPLGDARAVLKARDWLILPHGFFILYTPGNQHVDLVTNLGDMIGKGNKLPSRPEVKFR
jgi:hypothetical protein